jgi:small GTP-binding protein
LDTQLSFKRRILIVDDDARVAEVIRNGLSDYAEFEVSACTSGPGARSELQERPFDLLITDWRMPELDGLTLIRQTHERFPEMATVLMTAYGSSELKSAAGDTVLHYLEKPFEIDELIDVIKLVFPDAPPPVIPPKPLVMKVILGGDANVGKTSLIHRYRTGRFEPARTMTIAVDFHTCDVEVAGSAAKLIVWDLGGQGRFASLRKGFYRGSKAVGLVFDSGNRNSFYNLMRWWRDVREQLRDVPVLLLANKTDVPRQVSQEETAALATAWGIPAYEASCATGQGVAEFFKALAFLAWQHDRTQ